MSDASEGSAAPISPFRFSIKYGLIGGAVAAALMLLGFLVEAVPQQPVRLAGYGALLGVLLWGQWAYRKAETLAIGYGEAFGLGMLIVCGYAVVVTAYQIVHWTFLDPAMAERALAAAESTLRAQGLPEDQLEAALAMQSYIMGPIVTPLLGSLSTLVIGAVLALITSIFMRRKAE